jgi:hypothetical protein
VRVAPHDGQLARLGPGNSAEHHGQRGLVASVMAAL